MSVGDVMKYDIFIVCTWYIYRAINVCTRYNSGETSETERFYLGI